MFIYVYLCISLYIYVYHLCISMFIFVYLCISMYIYVYLRISMYIYVYLRIARPRASCAMLLLPTAHAAHCGMHALNNSLGAPLLTPQTMRTAAATYLRQLEGIDDAAGEHIRAGGWYPIQVLYTALFDQGYVLDFHNLVQSMAKAHGAVGLIQTSGNRRWVAYRWGGDGKIYLLDSMQPGLGQEFLASVARHAT